jgi:hypothetical protein
VSVALKRAVWYGFIWGNSCLKTLQWLEKKNGETAKKFESYAVARLGSPPGFPLRSITS